MNVAVNVCFKDKNGLDFKQILNYVNPEVTNATLLECVQKLNELTASTLDSVVKVIDEYLVVRSENDYVTQEQIDQVINGTWQIVFDTDPITDIQIASIFNGSYVPVEDDEPITQEQINNIVFGGN